MSKFAQAKTYFRHPIILLTIFLSFSACKKDDPFIADEITPLELLRYYIVTEYKYIGSAAQSRGEKSFMTVTHFKQTNAKVRINTAYVVSRLDTELLVEYDALSGITSLTTEGRLVVQLTRNRQGDIVLASSLNVPFPNSETVHSELVRDSSIGYYANYTAKGVENNTGYFQFLRARWMYSATNSINSLDWYFSTETGFLWFGEEGGDTRWSYLFVAIPKGTGWKGKRKDKDLLILFYVNGSKSVDGIVVGERPE